MPDTKAETARVDPGATRRRLASFIGGEAYKPDLLARVARLSVELNEPTEAGRFWFLSDAAGLEVDAAVEAFAKSCQRLPRLMASELPRFVRDWDLEQYTGPARERIERYGLAEALSRRAPRKPRRNRRRMTLIAVAGFGALLALAAVLVLLR